MVPPEFLRSHVHVAANESVAAGTEPVKLNRRPRTPAI